MSTDFDFLLGRWRVSNTRLARWLSNSRDWMEFESQHEERRLSSGQGTVAYHQYVLNDVTYERGILRSYNERFDFWKIDRLDGQAILSMMPLKGTFSLNKGFFLSRGTLRSLDVLVHVEWTRICETFACWEQALSKDNGRTWETNWIMEFFKQGSPNPADRVLRPGFNPNPY